MYLCRLIYGGRCTYAERFTVPTARPVFAHRAIAEWWVGLDLPSRVGVFTIHIRITFPPSKFPFCSSKLAKLLVLCLSRPPNRVRNSLCNLRRFNYRRVESTRRYASGSFANFLRRGVLAYSCLCVLQINTHSAHYTPKSCNTGFSTTAASIDKWFLAPWLCHLRAAPLSFGDLVL